MVIRRSRREAVRCRVEQIGGRQEAVARGAVGVVNAVGHASRHPIVGVIVEGVDRVIGQRQGRSPRQPLVARAAAVLHTVFRDALGHALCQCRELRLEIRSLLDRGPHLVARDVDQFVVEGAGGPAGDELGDGAGARGHRRVVDAVRGLQIVGDRVVSPAIGAACAGSVLSRQRRARRKDHGDGARRGAVAREVSAAVGGKHVEQPRRVPVHQVRSAGVRSDAVRAELVGARHRIPQAFGRAVPEGLDIERVPGQPSDCADCGCAAIPCGGAFGEQTGRTQFRAGQIAGYSLIWAVRHRAHRFFGVHGGHVTEQRLLGQIERGLGLLIARERQGGAALVHGVYEEEGAGHADQDQQKEQREPALFFV